MRNITDSGLDFIKHWEKFMPKPYNDGYGFITIGYGHVILSGEEFTSVDESEALEILRKDVEGAERSVVRLIKVNLTDNQFDALVSFAFNVGSGALQRSTLRSKINREEFDDAQYEFLKWTYSNGMKSKGLLKRREAERQLFIS